MGGQALAEVGKRLMREVNRRSTTKVAMRVTGIEQAAAPANGSKEFRDAGELVGTRCPCRPVDVDVPESHPGPP